MKHVLFLLIIGLILSLWGCTSPDAPVDASSNYIVQDDVKIEAQTKTDAYGIKLNIVISNLSSFYVFPNPNFEEDGFPTLFITLYYWGETISTYTDSNFESRYWDYGLPPGKSYEADYYFPRNDLPANADGDMEVRLSVQTEKGVGVPFVLKVPYAFVDNY